VALVLACNGPADTKAPVTVAAPAPEPAPPVVVVPAPAPVVAVAEPPAAPEPVAPAPDEKAPKFTRACEAGDRVTIAAVGDLLLHHELQIQAYASPDNFLAAVERGEAT
jgi:hypothetical protein